MKKFFLIFCLFFLSCFSLHAKWYSTFTTNEAKINYFAPFTSSLLSTYVFEGDKDGAFIGDMVAVLNDNSHWKIHPDHTEIYGKWQPGEAVHVDLRTSKYYFKREHKFALVNHNRNETVFVMLIASPLEIDTAGNPVYTSSMTINGVFHGLDYRINLIFNNGEQWEVDVDMSDLKWKSGWISWTREYQDKYFQAHTPVYVGYHEEEEKTYFFIINGTGKDARSRWARAGNYTYEL